jgi:hypothetical protein
MSRDGYLIDPQGSIRKSWWRNMVERIFVIPAILIFVAAVCIWDLILPEKIKW